MNGLLKNNLWWFLFYTKDGEGGVIMINSRDEYGIEV